MSRFKTVLPVIAGGLAAVAVAGCGGTTQTKTVTAGGTGAKSGSASGLPTSFARSGSQGMSINQIYRLDSPAVVDINVVSQSPSGQGSPLGGLTAGEGAGVVYNTNGDIVTDEHVVAGATKVTVNFQDGQSVSARVLGTDPSTDVGVIHVNVPASRLHPITFANSSIAQVGDPVIAIGSPFGQPETVTQGIVSQVGRSIMAPNNYTITGAIQTDAAINPGNSGGPVLDANARVLGLSDQIETSSQTATSQGQSSGVGFAVPANTVRQIARTIISGHRVQHSYVGICLNPATTNGAQVATQPVPTCPAPVKAGSPAAQAGLQPGDTITAVNGKSIPSTEAFITTVAAYKPGRTVTFTVKRGGQMKQIKVTLGQRPAGSPSSGAGQLP